MSSGILRRTELPAAFGACILLFGCGTFTLGRVQPQAGKSADQQQTDTLYCKDQANLAANSAGRQTGDFLLGLTIIGAPVAYEMDKAKQREVFANCMQAKGYTVVAPDDSGYKPATQAKVQASATGAAASSPVVPGLAYVKLELPPGFEPKATNDAQQRAGVVALSINRTVDVGVSMLVERHAGISDLSAYAQSRRAGQISRLQDSSASDVISLEIVGHKAYRFDARGTLNGVRLAYIVTILEGTDQLITVSSWTSAANFAAQTELMNGLASRVRGIQ